MAVCVRGVDSEREDSMETMSEVGAMLFHSSSSIDGFFLNLPCLCTCRLTWGQQGPPNHFPRSPSTDLRDIGHSYRSVATVIHNGCGHVFGVAIRFRSLIA